MTEKSSGMQERLRLFLPLFAAALFLLFANLGRPAIAGSEARWSIITREMMQSHDFFHPTINGEPYFDKPLLTYWMTVPFAWLRGGRVDELAARIPSAVMGLAALLSLYLLAKSLYDRKTGIIACWLFAGCYSFGFWGRLAEADMANLAFCTAASAWYFSFRKKAGFLHYLVFFLICSVGAHAKGMAALIVPVLGVLGDLIVSRNWKRHLGNWRLYAGAAVGLSIYFLPFLLSEWLAPAVAVTSREQTGIALAVRENITRFVAPFDHKEPFYSYLIHLPRQLALWAPLSLFAFFVMLFRWKREEDRVKTMILTIGLIFLFFSASGSKRHYYIMPILPWFTVLTAVFLNRVEEAVKAEKVKQVLLKIYGLLPVLIVLLGAAVCWFLRFFGRERFPGTDKVTGFLGCVLVLALVVLLFTGGVIRFRNRELDPADMPSPGLLKPLVLMALLQLFHFGFVHPALSSLRTEKSASLLIGRLLQAASPMKAGVFFYPKTLNNVFHYMDPAGPVPVLRTPEEFPADGGAFVITLQRDFDRLPPDLRKNMNVIFTEYRHPWEKPGKKCVFCFLRKKTGK